MLESLDPDATRHALAVGLRYLERRSGLSVARLAPAAGGDGFAVRVPGLAAPVSVLVRGNRVAVVYGRAGPAAALDAPIKLGQLASFRAAAAQLGGSLLPSGWLIPPRAAAFRGGRSGEVAGVQGGAALPAADRLRAARRQAREAARFDCGALGLERPWAGDAAEAERPGFAAGLHEPALARRLGRHIATTASATPRPG